LLLWRVVRKKMSLIRNFAQISCAASTPLARFYVPLSLFCTRGPGRFFNSALYWFWCFILHLALPGGQRGLRFAPPPLSAGPFGGSFSVCHNARAPLFAKRFFCSKAFCSAAPLRRGTVRRPWRRAAARGRVGWLFKVTTAKSLPARMPVSPACGRVSSALLPRQNHKNRAFPCIFHILYYLMYIKSAFFVVFFCFAAIYLPCPPWGIGIAGQQKSTAAFAAVLFVFFVLRPKGGHGPAPGCTAPPQFLIVRRPRLLF